MAKQVLLLDPGYMPVDIIHWTKAMQLLVTGDAEIVEEYEDVEIRSVSQSYKLPSILRLVRSFRRRKTVKFSRFNIFYRDGWTCQYCGEKKKSEELTFDHVTPKCARIESSKKSWKNIVSACVPCNRRKGGRLPEQVGPAQVYACEMHHKTYYELTGGTLPKHVRCLSCSDVAYKTEQVSNGMKLKKEPVKPAWTPNMTIRLKSTDPKSWVSYLYWMLPLEEST
jgi:5-methylcytosine-specific restriction endonuclease McrA